MIRANIQLIMGRLRSFLGFTCFCYLLLAINTFATDESPAGQNRTTAPTPGKVAPSHQKMLSLLKEIIRRAPDEHPYVGDRAARVLKAKLAALPADAPATTRLYLHRKLATSELNLGHERAAILHFTKADHLLPEVREASQPGEFNQLIQSFYFGLGVAYLRVGETQNCCNRFTPDSCILPIRGEGIYTKKEASKRAIGYFTEVLENSPKDSSEHLPARWLLNIAYMTIGAHPEGVPEAYRIGPKAFESDEPFPRFVNIAPRMGLDTFSLCGGAIADDFDNDGYLDLVVSAWDPAAQIRFFRNGQNGKFYDRTEQAGLIGITGGFNLVQADYDNDGHVDVLVLRGAWLPHGTEYPNSLLRNKGDGTFTDVTFQAGLGEVHYNTQTASWADYDNDGDLDLYVGNEALPGLPAPCQLFRNNGDGTFTDVARQAGVTNDWYAKAVVWGDYNGDRLPDLYVSNMVGPNRLYRNKGDGTFVNVAPELDVTHPKESFAAWFWDFDNDGVLDLYVADYSAGIEDIAAAYLGLPFEAELARLYRGDGNGGFKDVARERNLRRPAAPMGANFGDVDNDGYLDFYLGTGNTFYSSLMPNVMYRNREGKSFADVTTAGGFGHLQKGHAVVFADFDNDGDQDIFEEMGGAYPGDKFRDSFYQNPGFGHHWITVDLVGVQTNRSAIGARIRVEVVENSHPRSIYKHVNSGGTFGANPLRQTIGLGRAEKIELIEVYWPTSDHTQTLRSVDLDQHIKIVESKEGYTTRSLKRLKLGSSPQ